MLVNITDTDLQKQIDLYNGKCKHHRTDWEMDLHNACS